MRNADIYRGKKVAVIGLARSGLACANLLRSIGAEVSVTDSKPAELLRDAAGGLAYKDIRVETGGHTEDLINGRDLVVLSPGIPDSAAPVQWAFKRKIPVISEIEVAWTLCPCPVVAITGSNGKTTTTTLTGLVLNAGGRSVRVCGNIGNPFSGEVAGLSSRDFVVLEVSSFQLEKIVTFKPFIAIITNLNPNHLDRYSSVEEYIAAKKRIFLNQTAEDHIVLNASDPVVSKFASEARSKAVYFGMDEGLNPNQSAVVKAAEILGIERAVCLDVFKSFKGLEHRMEEVCSIEGVKFINDSKATTVESAVWALRNIPGNVVLIAGGKDKGLDYSLVLEAAKGKVTSAVLIGQAAGLIKKVFAGHIPFQDASDMRDAVRKAFKSAKKGDCVLLSPMCASYDMFSDYEERGRVFKSAVNELKREHCLK